jgi:hypothetical protein
MDCVSDDDGKLQEAKVESLRSIVVPAIDNSPPYAALMQTEKDSLTFDNEDALNTTVSSVGNYVKPKKNRGKRKTKDDISVMRDPVIKKKIVPPVRLSGGRNYVDASKFNRNYLQQNAISIPITKCGSPHLSCDALCVIDRRQDRSVTPSCSPMSDEDAKWSAKMPDHDMDCVSDDDGKLQEAKVESLRSVKPKKNRGKRKTKDDISGSGAILIALKDKVRSCNNMSLNITNY